MKNLSKITTVTALLAATNVLSGATITWSTPALIGDGSTSIAVAPGYSVFAAESAGGGNVTVNGIDFKDETTVGFTGGSGTLSSTTYYRGAGNSFVQTLLDSRYATTSANSLKVDISLTGLTAGTDYIVAIYLGDSDRTPDRLLYVGDAASNTTTFNPEDGYYVTGSFTTGAAETTQALFVNAAADATSQYPAVNAVLVMQAIPEPSIALLSSVAMLGLLRRKR